MIISLTAILLTACSQKVYIPHDCAYIEPLDVNITTNATGGLDEVNAYKAVTALKYYSKETRRLKSLAKAKDED